MAEMWAIGCIMAEIAEGRPLFRNSSEVGQIFDIFNVLGTPTAEEYPGLQLLEHFKPTFPQFKPRGLQTLYLDKQGVNFLLSLLVLNPEQRMTVREALHHPYL